MPDYKKMYLGLFNAVTTAINTLQEAQQQGEESYLQDDPAPLSLLKEKPTQDHPHK